MDATNRPAKTTCNECGGVYAADEHGIPVMHPRENIGEERYTDCPGALCSCCHGGTGPLCTGCARLPECARCYSRATPGAALCAPCAVEAATECPSCYDNATGPLCDACGPACKRCDGTGLVAYQIDVDDYGYYDCDCAAGEARTASATDAAVERMESRRAALGMVL